MKKQLIIIPRWGGGPSSDWYPWAKKELVEGEIFSRVEAIEMPDCNEPTLAAWSKAVSDVLSQNENALDHTVLLGHSVGFQAVLHALGGPTSKEKLHAVVGIAAWQDIDNPWPSLVPWVNFDHDFDSISKKSKAFHAMISDDDPFTRDFGANSTFWKEKLGATVQIVSKAHHFNDPQQNEVSELLRKLGSL